MRNTPEIIASTRNQMSIPSSRMRFDSLRIIRTGRTIITFHIEHGILFTTTLTCFSIGTLGYSNPEFINIAQNVREMAAWLER